jgi:hypothetical protein
VDVAHHEPPPSALARNDPGLLARIDPALQNDRSQRTDVPVHAHVIGVVAGVFAAENVTRRS